MLKKAAKPQAQELVLDHNTFLTLERVLTHASDDNGRFVLSSVFIECPKGLTMFVATDGHRLIREVNGRKGAALEPRIFPAQAIRAISAAMKATKASLVTVTCSPEKWEAVGDTHFGEFKMQGGMYHDRQFVPYQQVFTKTDKTATVLVSRFTKELRDILKRNEGKTQITITPSGEPGKGTLIIGGEHDDKRITASFECAWSSDTTFRAAFNLQFLLDALKMFEKRDIHVRLHVKDENSAMVIVPNDISSDDVIADNRAYAQVMPLNEVALHDDVAELSEVRHVS